MQQTVNERSFVAKPGEKSQINVYSFARLSPTKDGNPANETELPAFCQADGLQFCGRLNNTIHLCAFMNNRCCSTRPDQGFGARGGAV